MPIPNHLRVLRTGIVVTVVLGSACQVTAPEPAVGACTSDGQPLRAGFYTMFPPVSYSADDDPASPGFHTHLGYEADLLTALEAMDGVRLTFQRRPVAEWPGIWLLPSTPEVDIVGGGITILESRTRNDAGEVAVAFTSGHIAFRQSLLARSGDAARFSSYGGLTQDVRVGVFRATTGEARFLQIAGLADSEGILAAGTRVDTPRGSVVADGTSAYVITAAQASPALTGRTHIHPPSESMPQVVYLGDPTGDTEVFEALRGGTIDAVARGEIGNREASHATGEEFVVAALDSLAEFGGFALDARETALLACIDEKLNWLTSDRRIGYAEWRDDPSVFLERARLWEGG
ncbi:MAG: transporter substrate-binding domain-containing protein [Gammaproteobacteria bacterium]|nr:transporter substrate-binding domain-containing protein [Gammaproteobacteria bacterium]MDE0248294.1 transporter substrate-binding domain-containing protein [Gammaproteobacteria bacterium]